MAAEKNITGQYEQTANTTELATIDLGPNVVGVIKYFYIYTNNPAGALFRVTADAVPTLGGAGRFYASPANTVSAIVVDNERQVIISEDGAGNAARYINISIFQTAGFTTNWALSYVEIPTIQPSPASTFKNKITQLSNTPVAGILAATTPGSCIIKSIYVTRTTATPISFRVLVDSITYSDYSAPLGSGTVGFDMPIYLQNGDNLLLEVDIMNASNNIAYVSYTTNT